MALDVDTPSLRTVASDLRQAGLDFGQVGYNLGLRDEATHPDVAAGLQALTVAWGAALEVMAEDASYLSGRVDNAALVYDTTDENIAGGIQGPR